MARPAVVGAAAGFGFVCPLLALGLSAAGNLCEVKPTPYPRALRNPLKGFTTLNARTGHEWATLTHHYIRWNEIEDVEADGIEKIRAYCDRKWDGFADKNVKVIPRVYLHWDGEDRKFWPADLQPDDYTSPAFRKRLLRLVDRLGTVWDNDPRVAFVELGIFGKWGEHHSPSPTPDMQQLAGTAFRKAFRRKLVSVRHAWSEFTGFGFGEYWDSWAHYQQMWAHGRQIYGLNARTGLWKTAYIGGETAYNWGQWRIQPGDNATDSVSDADHRDFVINSIRWLHATQLRWIGEYDTSDAAAREGAEQVQKVLGYRFAVDRVRFTPRLDHGTPLQVELTVRNEGAAPFYYRWPLEVSLLARDTRAVVWKRTFEDVDIRTWLPGDGWTQPEWMPIAAWPRKGPNPHWSDTPPQWATPPKQYTVSSTFAVDLKPGTYILAVAILDPAGMLPAVRFATGNYLAGGRHPLGLVGVNIGAGGPLPADFAFDDPHADRSLHYQATP